MFCNYFDIIFINTLLGYYLYKVATNKHVQEIIISLTEYIKSKNNDFQIRVKNKSKELAFYSIYMYSYFQILFRKYTRQYIKKNANEDANEDANEELFIIYKWYPIQICKIDYDKKELNIVKEIKVPDIFYNFRGSTNGVSFNNKFWFIIHSQNKIDEKNHYFHRFVVLNKDLTIYGYSEMFKFQNYIVEFCVGMELTYKNNFVVTYSTLDSTTNLCVILVKTIEKLLIIV